MEEKNNCEEEKRRERDRLKEKTNWEEERRKRKTGGKKEIVDYIRIRNRRKKTKWRT